MTRESNARAFETLDIGAIGQVTEIPMYYAPEQATAFREWLTESAKQAGFTNNTKAHVNQILVRVNGDNIGLIASWQTNPDTPDLTAPENAPVDDDNNPDPRHDPRSGGQDKPVDA